MSREDFARALDQFPFSDRGAINAVHMHHTFHPTRAEWRGLETMDAMWRFHTQIRRFNDIAQHITIDPEGGVWTGRGWNVPPASATGNNGNAQRYPFMFETVGDFDLGRESFDGPQRETVIDVIARLQVRFDLPPESLRFHRHMSTKTCPGSSIVYEEIVAAVKDRRDEIEKETSRATPTIRGPFTEAEREVRFGLPALLTRDGDGAAVLEPVDAEPNDQAMSSFESGFVTLSEPAVLPVPEAANRAARDRSAELTPEDFRNLRPHLINLTLGRFSTEGSFQTSSGDVDAIFEEHLPEWRRTHPGPVKLLFYAHGGLTSEKSGLQSASANIEWWKSNGIYPIYFVWETGLIETLGHIISGAGRGVRDIFDFTSDPAIETVARVGGGLTIWSGMKRSAELAVAPEGGAAYTAQRLAGFCSAHGDTELYGVGHSAGSIFHAYFVPSALDAGVPAFRALHFLAPAIRVDTFKQRLLPKIGHGIDELTVFTMTKDWERADNCGRVYRKSLLYLVSNAFERERGAGILGLEESLRSDSDLKQFFGLSSNPGSAKGSVIWSVSSADSGFSASRAKTHGGFDNEPFTMNSVLRRILARETGAIQPYPEQASRDVAFAAWNPPEPAALPVRTHPDSLADLERPSQRPKRTTRPPSFGSSRKLALCVGINAYATAPLNGCVADAEAWHETLNQLGFATTLITDNQATHAGIIGAMERPIASSAAGDVLVFQYAGHGTSVPDTNGDEASGDTPTLDEALCPFDFHTGSFLIDDDVAQVFSKLPGGVNLTCFIDCCHSGTISRFAIGNVPGTEATGDRRPRFVVPSAEEIHKHLQFRAGREGARESRSRGPEEMREVLFSACTSAEVAWESNGHGDFTRNALPILLSGEAGMTHDQFQKRVVAAFGETPRQHPTLDCAPDAKRLPLLQPIGAGAPNDVPVPARTAKPGKKRDVDAIAQGFRLIADLLEQER